MRFTPAASIAEKASFGGLLVILVGLGFYQGLQQNLLQLDLLFVVIELIWVDAASAAIGFSASILVLGALSLWTLSREAPIEPVQDGGTVTAIIPVYQDGDVLQRSVESLLDAEYEDIDICIVCEEEDTDSIAAAETLAETDDSISVSINTTYPGTKAGAINHAAEETDSPYIAVFDADHAVENGFIGRAVARLQDCDIVQGRGILNPSGIIESLSYYENALLIGTTRLLSAVFNFTWAGSTSIVMHRRQFEALDGYNIDAVTEDYEFAHRCYQEQVDVHRIVSATSVGEAPHNLNDFWKQRKRWIIGQFQVLHLLLRDAVTGVPDRRQLLSCLVASSTAFGGMFLLMLLPKLVILAAFGMFHLIALPISLIMIFGAVFHVNDTLYGPLDRIGMKWLLAPVPILFLGLVTAKSLPEYLLTWSGEWYHVQKGT